MKFYLSSLLLFHLFSTFGQQKASSVFTLYNETYLLTGNDRMNLDQDRIDSVKIFKGKDSVPFFEKADGVIMIYLRHPMEKEFLTTPQINALLGLPADRPIYVNGVRAKQPFLYSNNSKTILEKIKRDGINYAHVKVY